MPFPLSEHSRKSIEQHFRKKGDFVWSESFFLSVLHTSGNKYDLWQAAIGLREVGTEQAVEPLRAMLMYPNFDVQAVALLTIAHIAGQRATPIYIEALENPAYRQKDYALWAIADAADTRAIPHVSGYLAKNSKRFKSGKLRRTPLHYIIKYLARFSDTEAEAKVLLEKIPEVWFGIPEFDRKGISREFPKLAEQFNNACEPPRRDDSS